MKYLQLLLVLTILEFWFMVCLESGFLVLFALLLLHYSSPSIGGMSNKSATSTSSPSCVGMSDESKNFTSSTFSGSLSGF